jgi:hypothetical protein
MLKNVHLNALSKLGLLAPSRITTMAASKGNHGLSKKSQSFIEFPFIYLDNLKYDKQIISFFLFKIFILPPLGLWRRGRPHHTPSTLLPHCFPETCSKNRTQDMLHPLITFMSGWSSVSSKARGDIRFTGAMRRTPPRPYRRDVNPTELVCNATQNRNKSPDDLTVKWRLYRGPLILLKIWKTIGVEMHWRRSRKWLCRMNLVMANGNEDDADSNIVADDNDEGSSTDRIDWQSIWQSY